jgi:hypothetical protein
MRAGRIIGHTALQMRGECALLGRIMVRFDFLKEIDVGLGDPYEKELIQEADQDEALFGAKGELPFDLELRSGQGEAGPGAIAPQKEEQKEDEPQQEKERAGHLEHHGVGEAIQAASPFPWG